MVTFIQAAIQVLEEANQPLSSDEITRRAINQGLISTNGITPIRSMNARLHYEIKGKGTKSRVKQVGPNLFALSSLQTDISSLELPSSKLRNRKVIVNRGLPEKTSFHIHEIIDNEVKAIKGFLDGLNGQIPTGEKLCDWVSLCYLLGLYSEGVELFTFVVRDEVNEWYYRRSKRISKLCEMRTNPS